MCENEDRVHGLREALLDIKKIAEFSEGRAAKFYGMMAEKALKSDEDLMQKLRQNLT